jgi:hypothetical protein
VPSCCCALLLMRAAMHVARGPAPLLPAAGPRRTLRTLLSPVGRSEGAAAMAAAAAKPPGSVTPMAKYKLVFLGDQSVGSAQRLFSGRGDTREAGGRARGRAGGGADSADV